MDIVLIVISSLSLLISAIVLILFITTKKEKPKALTEEDLKKIRESVNESVNSLSMSVSNLISEKNKSSFDSISLKMNELDAQIKYLIDNHHSSTKEQGEFLLKLSLENKRSKDEMMENLKKEIDSFNLEVNKTLSDFETKLKEKMEELRKEDKESFALLNTTVEKNLNQIRQDNTEKLDSIQKSVNEKLEKTLEDKLKDSFDNVIRSIGNVNSEIGEIKSLAADVGSLKNVLTNVKTKGIVGEILLGNIIREFLTTSQYDENVITKSGSSERVEFAVKLPGNGDKMVYLPIDSKFPYESYSRILESNDIDEIKEQRKLLRLNLLKYAKDVSEKYIDAPNTTDFAIIFLPLEGLYLEALNLGLFEEIQTKYKVNLTGPTTLTAFINALEMGFKSLMIERKSADVFKLLSAVKTEFSKFADALEKTQKKMNDASSELDTLVGTRTRMMNSKLKSIESLDEGEAQKLLEDPE